MALSRAARRYAQALFESAKDNKVADAVAEELQAFALALTASAELQTFVKDPVIPKDEKKKVIKSLFTSRLNPFILRFLEFLIEKRRLDLIGEISRIYQTLYLQYKNVAEIEITSAYPLEQTQVQQICDRLKKKFNKDIRARVGTDPALIGGFKVKSGDMVFDFTLLSQLDKFRHSISTI